MVNEIFVYLLFLEVTIYQRHWKWTWPTSKSDNKLTKSVEFTNKFPRLNVYFKITE